MILIITFVLTVDTTEIAFIKLTTSMAYYMPLDLSKWVISSAFVCNPTRDEAEK